LGIRAAASHSCLGDLSLLNMCSMPPALRHQHEHGSLPTVVVQPSELSGDTKVHAAGMSIGVLVAADRGKVQIPQVVDLVEVDQHPDVSGLQLPWRKFPQNVGCLPPKLPHLILLAQKRRAALEIIAALPDFAPRCRFHFDAMNVQILSLAEQKFPAKSSQAILTFLYSLVN
jgi:hypothetical protein